MAPGRFALVKKEGVHVAARSHRTWIAIANAGALRMVHRLRCSDCGMQQREKHRRDEPHDGSTRARGWRKWGNFERYRGDPRSRPEW